MTAYHKWLIRQRIYCEDLGCADRFTQATHVIKNRFGRDTVICYEHSDLCAAAHTSEQSTLGDRP